MHYIAATTLLFAASALAAKNGWQPNQDWRPRQWGNGINGWGNRNGWGPGGNPQPPLDYRYACKCLLNQQEDEWLGQSACNQLAGIWGNLYWDGQACKDNNNVGLDVNGFSAACQRAAQSQNQNSFNAQAATADCSPY